MDLLRDFHDVQVDTATSLYVEQAEMRWGTALRQLRQDRSVGTLKAKSGWAMIRYHWSVPFIPWS